MKGLNYLYLNVLLLFVINVHPTYHSYKDRVLGECVFLNLHCMVTSVNDIIKHIFCKAIEF